ncbi:MAG: signal recognition particle protein [Vampirovibrionales bacterium]|nr:signal recognition particle protein [Vampirovibrionales bacterium]
MFDALSERLQGVFDSFRGEKTLTPENMESALREIRRALLEADVNLRVVKSFLSRVKDRAEGEAVLKTLNPSQQLVKIVHDELVALLGGERQPLDIQTGDPPLMMLFGLQGSGKTTTAAKLALKLRREGHRPLLIAADVYRPAAIDQLVTLGAQIGIPTHSLNDSTDVQAIVRSGIDRARAEDLRPVIIDTAGRLQADASMMAELLLLERVFKPAEKLLVVDAMTGQEAVAVAETFNAQLALTGLAMTKMDGDARGGAALSVASVTGKPIKLIGVSEKPDGLEDFHPDRLATRILGMGDVLTLVEKAQQAVNAEDAKRLEKQFRKQTFSFEDFRNLQKQMKLLGSFDQILGMLPIPGLDKSMRQQLAQGGEQQMKRIDAMIASMTPAERQTPDLLSAQGRVRRIAKGCGMPEPEVRQFLKQFEQMKQVMKAMTQMGDAVKSGKAPAGGFKLPGMGGMKPGSLKSDAFKPEKKKRKKSGLFASLDGQIPASPSGEPSDKKPPFLL